MARETTTVIRSDLSGQVIPEGEAVKITIEFARRGRRRIELDVAEHEVAELVERGRDRGRGRHGRRAGPA